MAVGIQEVQLQRVESLGPSAAGQGEPVRGLSSSQDAFPHAEPATGAVNVMSPAERFQRAVEAGPLSPSERAAFRSLVAQEYARAEQRRNPPSPQGDLELAA